MATLTLRLADDNHNRLKALAMHKKTSINKLIEQMTIQTLAGFDSETRFRNSLLLFKLLHIFLYLFAAFYSA